VKTVVRLSTSDRVIFQHGGKMNAMADIRNNDGRTILIVEDNDELRETLSEWLKSVFCDCTFQVAGSGEKAIELAGAHHPAIVIMDIQLPRINGIEAIRHIKMISPKTQEVLLIVINDPECIDVAMAAGACAVVKKQHMHVELIPVLTKILSQEITEGEKA
jgi:CheY-like chemotaxis protein